MAAKKNVWCVAACLASAMPLITVQTSATEPPAAEPKDESSTVNWPVELPGEVAAPSKQEPREKTVMQLQIEQERGPIAPLQISQAQATDIAAAPIVDGGKRAQPIAQLSENDRQIVLDTFEGTDICDRDERSPDVTQLCNQRIENRSEEFATSNRRILSADERLLSESIGGNGVNSLEQAIEQLGRNASDVNSPANQAIAAIVLGTGQEEPTPDEGAETAQDGQGFPLDAGALIDGTVQQSGNILPQ